jgi:hypothetical protein
LLIIGVCATIAFAVNAIFMEWWLSLLLTLVGVVGCIILHAGGSGLVYSLRKFIKPEAKYFKVSKKETRFWERLGVRLYKDRLPDLGAKFVGFEKARLANPKDLDYIKKYIHETCVGEIGHIVGGILGFAVMAFMPFSYYWLSIALPCAIVNLFLATLPFIVMRYNRHKLVALHKIIEIQNKREETKKNKEETES